MFLKAYKFIIEKINIYKGQKIGDRVLTLTRNVGGAYESW